MTVKGLVLLVVACILQTCYFSFLIRIAVLLLFFIRVYDILVILHSTGRRRILSGYLEIGLWDSRLVARRAVNNYIYIWIYRQSQLSLHFIFYPSLPSHIGLYDKPFHQNDNDCQLVVQQNRTPLCDIKIYFRCLEVETVTILTKRIMNFRVLLPKRRDDVNSVSDSARRLVMAAGLRNSRRRYFMLMCFGTSGFRKTIYGHWNTVVSRLQLIYCCVTCCMMLLLPYKNSVCLALSTWVAVTGVRALLGMLFSILLHSTPCHPITASRKITGLIFCQSRLTLKQTGHLILFMTQCVLVNP